MEAQNVILKLWKKNSRFCIEFDNSENEEGSNISSAIKPKKIEVKVP